MHEPALRQCIVESRLVLGRAVVPYDQIVHAPVVAILELRFHAMCSQLSKQIAALVFRQAEYAHREAVAHVETFTPGHRMHPDHWMHGFRLLLCGGT